MGETLPPEKAADPEAAKPSDQTTAAVAPPGASAAPADPVKPAAPATPPAQVAPSQTPAPPVAPSTPPDTTPPQKPIVTFDAVADDLRQIPVHRSVSAPVQPEDSVDPDRDYISQLSEDAQADILDMADAERFGGDRYKGAKAKLVSYYKQVDSIVEKLKAEDPSRTLDENDPGFTSAIRSLMKTKPRISATDKRRVMESAISQRAKDEAMRAVAPEIDRVSRANAEAAANQRLGAALSKFEELTRKLATDTSDIPELKELADRPDDPELKLEADILSENINRAKEWVSEYVKIGRSLITTSVDKFTDTQRAMNNFLCQVGDEYAATPQAKQKQGGKEFVPLHVYRQIYETNPNDLSKYWTFSEQQVISLFALKAKNDACAQLKHEKAVRQKYGFTRVRKNSPDPQNPQPNPSTNPAPPEPQRPVTARPTPPAVGGKSKPAIPDEAFNPVALYGLGS